MTSSIPFRPRSVSELVDAAFQVLRRSYLQFVIVMGIAYIPWLVLTMLLARWAGLDPGVGELTLGRSFATMMVFVVGGLIWFALVDGAMTVAASESYLGRPVDVGGAFRRGFARVGPLIGAAVLRGLLITFGFFLLIVGAVYFFAKYFASSVIVMLEGEGALGSLRRSSALTDGRKGHVLKTMLLVWLIYIVLYFAVLTVTGLLTGGAGGAATSPAAAVATQIVGAVFAILVYPLISVAQTLLYYDLRIRKEGYDIELMAGELDGRGGGAEEQRQQPAY